MEMRRWVVQRRWLACFENLSGPQGEKIRKDFIKTFKEEFDIKITR